MLSTPPAFILSQDRTLKKNFESQFGSNYFNKNSILRIEKGPFYFKFCILFNFQDPRFPLISRHIYVVPPSKCSIILIRRAYSVKDFFPVFWTFFLHDLKVYAYYFKYCTLLSVKSRTIRLSESRNIYIYNITHLLCQSGRTYPFACPHGICNQLSRTGLFSRL